MKDGFLVQVFTARRIVKSRYDDIFVLVTLFSQFFIFHCNFLGFIFP